MLTSRQRSRLISLGSKETPCGQVGKGGIGQNMVKSFSDCLEARELIKVNLLPGSGDNPRETAEQLAGALGAELVTVIGRKAVLYRKSGRDGIEHIKI